ncbi:MAG: FAD-binding protein [Bacteroidia bacterium]|nr:FAD-binding protein [Bacteroidia bacterium]
MDTNLFLRKRDFGNITPELIDRFQGIVGERFAATSLEVLSTYSHDWTENFRFLPHLVVFPANTQEVAEALRLCSENNIPVTPVGARTGLSGGMLPVYGGVALSLERMNQILEIDTANLQVRVQPGVITGVLQEAVAKLGLYYPPDPSSKGSCFIGGNLAESSGGIHAVKYGITRDYVLALEAVLPSGEIIHTGAKVLKNSTGYNLTQLLVGSEGTLAVITEATLRLVHQPKYSLIMQAPFESAEDCCDAVSAIFHTGIVPAALEFMEQDAIRYAQNYLKVNHYQLEGIGALLLIEVDGNNLDILWQECEIISAVISKYKGGEVMVAESAEQQQALWALRRCLGKAVKGNTIYKEEDTVVPRAYLAKLLRFVKKKGIEFGFESVCYGHAGDGNLHINILKNDISDDRWEHELPQAIREIFEYTVSLGGTLSGEHGIGYVQRPYMDIAFSATELTILKNIKQVFDPQGILNPGKIFL